MQERIMVMFLVYATAGGGRYIAISAFHLYSYIENYIYYMYSTAVFYNQNRYNKPMKYNLL